MEKQNNQSLRDPGRRKTNQPLLLLPYQAIFPMDPRDTYPTSVLKVNLGCCRACEVGLKKLLSTVAGVKGYELDLEKGLVTVVGRANPEVLVEKIRQMKKKAEIVSHEIPTPNAKTKEDKKTGNLDSKSKEKKKRNGNGDQKGFKEAQLICQHESDQHEIEDYVPPKPALLDTCRDPYCKLHNMPAPIIRASDNMPRFMLPPPSNRSRFLPPPPRFFPPPPGPHNPPPPGPHNPNLRSYRQEYLDDRPSSPRFFPPPPGPNHPLSYRQDHSEDHRYSFPRVEPIVYDRSIYDSGYHQRPLPQSDPWCYQKPQSPLSPQYGYQGIRHTYPGYH